jgi:hypothetical protein
MAGKVKTIGIIGAGTMGSGIGLVALNAGYDVIVQDAFPHMLEKGRDYIQKFLEKKGTADRIARVKLTDSLREFVSADVIIEAAPEMLEVKQDLFKPRPRILLASLVCIFLTQRPFCRWWRLCVPPRAVRKPCRLSLSLQLTSARRPWLRAILQALS